VGRDAYILDSTLRIEHTDRQADGFGGRLRSGVHALITLATAAWFAASAALPAAPIAQDRPTNRLLRFPDVHGERIVFTYAGDLWISNTTSGVTRRLTSSSGTEGSAKFSPDGKLIAFSAQYDGAGDVYVIPVEGGEPTRLTFDPEPDNVLDWTPDGKIAYASTHGSITNRQARLYHLSPKGGLPISTPIHEVGQASYFADGKRVAYNRQNSNNFNWRRYRGGSQGRISFFDLEKGTYSELPAKREQNYFPMVIGDDVYYVSDKNLGTLNLYRYNVANKRETQITKYTDSDIKNPGFDQKSIVWERDGRLWRYEVGSNAEPVAIAPVLNAENLWSRPAMRNVGGAITSAAVSPSGSRVLAEARGEIFSLPAKNGDTRNLTQSPASRERFPIWSPDGKTVAYVSDKSGEFEVYVQPQLGGEETKLTDAKLPIAALEFSPDSKAIAITTRSYAMYWLDIATKKLTLVAKPEYGFGGYTISPDSKWIAYVAGRPNGLSQVMMYEVATGKSTPITSGRYDDGSVSFDLGGKYLYLVSTRTFAPSFGTYEFSLKVEDGQRAYVLPLSKETPNPLFTPNDEEPDGAGAAPAGRAPGGAPGSPPTAGSAAAASSGPTVKIDFEGAESRLIPLPVPPGNYRTVGVNNGVLLFSGGTIQKYDLGARELTPVGPVPGAVAFNATRSKMVYWGGAGLGVADVRPGFNPASGRVDTNSVDMRWDPRAEWRQMYWESWRFLRDNFYDPDMRGVDWTAIGRKYEAYLEDVNHRSDLSYVLGLMIGELGTGHAYVQGGEFGVGPAPVPVGQLGCDFQVSGNFVRISKVLRGDNFDESRRAPLAEPGIDVRDGDYLLAINGTKVTADTHPGSLLLNRVGRYVTLTVNSSPSMEGARKVRVRPASTESNLRYIDFVEQCRQKVEAASGGRIGYMHIPNTAFEGAVEFVRGFYSQTDKEAMIVDERWNGGGYIQPWFVDTLARKTRIGIQNRHGADSPDAPAIDGPKVMLINGYAGSGGDFFPWMFRQSKLGPLVGTRTWGGLVGISAGAPLVDGGQVTAPEFSLFDRDKNEIIAENTGIDPDIEVDARPDLWAKGQDPQLERAIAILMEQLKSIPAKKPRTKLPEIGDKGKVKG
jgi:tricorn protease